MKAIRIQVEEKQEVISPSVHMNNSCSEFPVFQKPSSITEWYALGLLHNQSLMNDHPGLEPLSAEEFEKFGKSEVGRVYRNRHPYRFRTKHESE